MAAAVEFLVPTPPRGMQRVKVPDTMTTEERERLLKELSGISLGLARIDAREEERQKLLEQRFVGLETRLSKLEGLADENGVQRVQAMQAKLSEERALATAKLAEERAVMARERAQSDKVRDRIWSIFAVLLVSGIVGLVTHYLSTR